MWDKWVYAWDDDGSEARWVNMDFDGNIDIDERLKSINYNELSQYVKKPYTQEDGGVKTMALIINPLDCTYKFWNQVSYPITSIGSA